MSAVIVSPGATGRGSAIRTSVSSSRLSPLRAASGVQMIRAVHFSNGEADDVDVSPMLRAAPAAPRSEGGSQKDAFFVLECIEVEMEVNFVGGLRRRVLANERIPYLLLCGRPRSRSPRGCTTRLAWPRSAWRSRCRTGVPRLPGARSRAVSLRARQRSDEERELLASRSSRSGPRRSLRLSRRGSRPMPKAGFRPGLPRRPSSSCGESGISDRARSRSAERGCT